MKRNKFSLSNTKLLTANQGDLIPINVCEVHAGDTIQQATSALIRVSPLNAPVMHPVHARIHHFFVPYRLLWDNWEDFITGGPDGLDASVFPTITFGGGSGLAVGSLGDYMGLPTGVNNITVSALPFRAYNLIYNEYYRDSDLQTELAIDTGDGTDSTTETNLKQVCWEKDYFTASRSSTQKGAEVTLPLGDTAPVLGIGKTNQNFATGPLSVYESDGTSSSYSKYAGIHDGGADNYFMVEEGSTGYPNIRADLSQASAATVNQVREAFAIQKYQEARMRYGSKYSEYLRYLGISPSDARLQRPEYLGGGKQTIQFSEVLQTGVDSTDAGLGNLGGHGIGALKSNRYRKFFEEHGVIISMLSVKPKTIYSQGIPKMFLRNTKEDFIQKELQFIGAEEILNKEIYAAHSSPDGVFSYQDRYDSWRKSFSSIAGEFKTTLNHWHMARIFTGDVALNSSFVTANPTDRIYASTATDQLYIMIANSIQARRALAKEGTPGGL